MIINPSLRVLVIYGEIARERSSPYRLEGGQVLLERRRERSINCNPHLQRKRYEPSGASSRAVHFLYDTGALEAEVISFVEMI